jgi:hypothetical protein
MPCLRRLEDVRCRLNDVFEDLRVLENTRTQAGKCVYTHRRAYVNSGGTESVLREAVVPSLRNNWITCRAFPFQPSERYLKLPVGGCLSYALRTLERFLDAAYTC